MQTTHFSNLKKRPSTASTSEKGSSKKIRTPRESLTLPNSVKGEYAYLVNNFMPSPPSVGTLHAAISWDAPCTIMGNPIPRTITAFGDGLTYKYGGRRHGSQPWKDAPAFVIALRTKACEHADTEFNFAVVNYYADHTKSVGRHSDNEPEMDKDAPIVSYSIGASRPFRITPMRTAATKGKRLPCLTVDLAHNSMLCMLPGMQERYEHEIKKLSKCTGARINITFRRFRVYDD